ncbi:MAG: choice-of-anchor D domain-containing protein [Phycisphaerae bacterium]|nr:choice-of-anchor D domain-containing protein [Phycisphaerae bacterium]
MLFRSNRKDDNSNNRKRLRSRRNQFVLESLDKRVLLSASTDYLGAVDFVDEQVEQPQADFFFADPALSNLYGMDIEAQIANDHNEIISESDGVYTILPASGVNIQTLYIDFDGARVYNSPTDFYLGSAYRDIPAYSLTNLGFAGQEQQSIDYIMEFVTEDYAAYNVAVTDIKPTSGSYTTLHVGGSGWFENTSYIGVATMDYFNSSESNYGFAFSESLSYYANYSHGNLEVFSEYLANLISHEAAHTFGMGHVNNPEALMNPYLALNPVTSSFGSDSSQDTETLMGRYVGYKNGVSDDYGDSIASAEVVTANTVISGILEARDDSDAFRFVANASGEMTINLATTDFGNLNGVLNVYNSNGQMVATNDNYNGSVDPQVEFDAVAAGVYTVVVSSSSENSSGTYTLALGDIECGPEISICDSCGLSDDMSMDMGTVQTGQLITEAFTVSNNGSENLIVSEILVHGDFVVEAAEGGSGAFILANGQSKTFNVTYSPVSQGIDNGTITLISNDQDSASTVITVAGEAVARQGDISADSAVDFGQLSRNVQGQQTITINNNGTLDLTISDIALSAPFVLVSGFDDTATIAPDGQLEVVVSVSSQYRGEIDGSMVIRSNDPDEPVSTVSLEAQIVGGVLAIEEHYQTVNDASIDFDNVYIGQNITKAVTLKNDGDDVLTVSAIDVNSNFELDNVLTMADINDDIVLQPGESLDIEVSYSPEQIESINGAITITTDNIESPNSTITLAADGASDPLLVTEADGADDGVFDAGRVRVGSVIYVNAWTLENDGNELLTIELAVGLGSGVAINGPSTIILAPGQSYDVSLRLNCYDARAIGNTVTATALESSSIATLDVEGQGYALVSRGDKYRFVDQDGDLVTVSMSGDGSAEVMLGQMGDADIESINVIGGTNTSLTVKTSGSTELNALTGDINLKTLKAKNIDIVGDGIDYDAVIGSLKIGDIQASVNFDSDLKGASVKAGNVTQNSAIKIDGILRSFTAIEFDGQLEANGMGNVKVDSLEGDIAAGVGGIGKLMIKDGDLTGSVDSAGDINMIKAKGDIRGSINSGTIINKIKAWNLNEADITALSGINNVAVNNMIDSDITVGNSAAFSNGSYRGISVDAFLGKLNVKGTFSGSNVAVGIELDGTAIATTGNIDAINIANVQTSNDGQTFGLSASDSIGKMKIQGKKVLGQYEQDDFMINII